MIRLFKKLFGQMPFLRGEQAIVLPEDVIQTITIGKAYQLRAFIEWASSQSNRAKIEEKLISACEESGWPEKELNKIRAYAAYFSRNYQAAYEYSARFAKGKNFDADYFGLACMALYNTNQFDLAYRLLRDVKAHENELLGNIDYLLAAILICWSAGDRYLTEKYLQMASRFELTNDVVIRFNALVINFELGNLAEAERDAVPKPGEPIVPSYQFSRAFVKLAGNDYAEGFRMAESRYEIPEAYRYMRIELMEKPRWLGEDIADKTLLIHGEQGLGDMIMTARYFAHAQQAAKHVIVDCPAESIALFEHNFPEMSFTPLDVLKPIQGEFDTWLGTLSLPYVYGSVCETIPGKDGYLQIPGDHVSYWRNRVCECSRPGHIKIGIAWSGFPGHRADRRRSIPWHMVKPLLEQNPEADFYALQVKVPDDLPANLHNFTEEMATLSDTTALINEMDLVISVDTSIVHMAGAIGKKTWMLLPYRYEWRWGLEGESNCWYNSVKVLRQPAPGAWAPILSKAFGRGIKAFVRESTSS